MADPIAVPTGFKADFSLMCSRAGMTEREVHILRNQIRERSADLVPWVQETAAVYRFCDATWGEGRMPTPDLCQGLLAHHGWYPEDEGMFQRQGILLLAKLCAQVAGAMPN